MNLQELLDKSSPEDRQLIIDYFVLWLQGKSNGEPLVIRKTAKLSTLSSEEDMKKQLSTIFDKPIEEFDKFNFLEDINNIDSNYRKVEAIITPYKNYLISLKSKEDKFEELNDIGRFLVSLQIPCSIIIPENVLPYPDFIIENKEKNIGIEHTRLLNVGSQRLIKNIKQILKIAEKNLLSKEEKFTQVVNISLNYQTEILNNKSLSTPTLTKVEKELIAELISNWIYSHLKNLNTPKPSFIDKIGVSIDSIHPLSINLAESYIGKVEIEKILMERLESKEKKVSRYSTIKDFDELWLVIIVNGVTAASSFIIEEAKLKSKIASSFTKVFLFDSFSNNALLIYQSDITNM